MSDSVWPHRLQPTRLLCPWDSPGKNTGVGCLSFSNAWKWKVKVKSLSRACLLVTPWTGAYQAPQFMGFSRQEYWSEVPLPSPTICIYTFNRFSEIWKLSHRSCFWLSLIFALNIHVHIRPIILIQLKLSNTCYISELAIGNRWLIICPVPKKLIF